MKTIEDYRIDGYNDGYTWLTRGSNFLHYSQPKGYIPGGPHIHVPFMSYGQTRNQALRYVADCTKAWRDGWVAGIDAYVREHNLSF